jgi:hypothetical protein
MHPPAADFRDHTPPTDLTGRLIRNIADPAQRARAWEDWEDQCVRAEEQNFRDAPDLAPLEDLYVDGPHLNVQMGWNVNVG